MRDELENLRGQDVEVIYNGLIYKGKLIGASESEIDLQTREQWISLPMEGITAVKRVGGEEGLYFEQDEGSEEIPP
jgi:hypothetical protein